VGALCSFRVDERERTLDVTICTNRAFMVQFTKNNYGLDLPYALKVVFQDFSKDVFSFWSLHSRTRW
jgi:hypothetical protein